MKILLLNDMATLAGGAEGLTQQLAEELRSRGHEVHVLASSARPTSDASFADSTFYGTFKPWRPLIGCVNPSAYMAVRRLLKSFRPDVVHVRMMLTQISPAVLPLLRDVPSIYHATWYRAVCPTGMKQLPDGSVCQVLPGRVCHTNGCLSSLQWGPAMLQRSLWKRWRSAFDAVISNSHGTAQRLAEDGMGESHVIWNGVGRVAVRAALSDVPTIAYVGRLSPEKGIETLIRAFAMMRSQQGNARLIIIGQGPDERRLRELAVTLLCEGSIEFKGHLSRSRMEQACRSAWIQAVPSEWDEPFGLVAAESMMRGTATVASNTGGPSEIIEDGVTGRLVEPGNAAAWADVLGDLARSPAEVSRLGEAARKFAIEHLTLERFADQCEALYRVVRDRHRNESQSGPVRSSR